MTAGATESSLKCVVGLSPHRALGDVLAGELGSRLRIDDQRSLGRQTILVYAAASPSEIRDALAGALADDESVLVCEFERWSSYGGDVDAEWLLRRGH